MRYLIIIMLFLLFSCSDSNDNTVQPDIPKFDPPVDIRNSSGIWCISGKENGEIVNYYFPMWFSPSENSVEIIYNPDIKACGFVWRDPFRGFSRYDYEDGILYLYSIDVELKFIDSDNFVSDYDFMKSGTRLSK